MSFRQRRRFTLACRWGGLGLLSGCTPEPPSKTDWGEQAGGADTGALDNNPLTSASFAQIASFNAEWLADHYTTTATERDDFQPRLAADYEMMRSLILAYDLDVIGLQEVEGDGAMELLGLPSRYAWVSGDTGWSQNLVIVYRSDRFTLENIRQVRLPSNSGAARAPLVGELRSRDGTLGFTLVVVHNNPYEDLNEARLRARQVEELVDWLSDELPDTAADDLGDQVIVLGDFNDSFVGINPSVPSLGPLEQRAGLQMASRNTTGFSYISFQSLIDHIALSPTLVERWTDRDDPEGFHPIAHDELEPWSSYTDGYRGVPNISDHRPVWVQLETGA